MSIVVKYKKVVDMDGDRRIKILGVDALRRDELPQKYLDGPLYCVLEGEDMLVVHDTEHCHSYYLSVGRTHSIETFSQVIKLLRECGRRLHEINRELREKREKKRNWKGTGTIII